MTEHAPPKRRRGRRREHVLRVPCFDEERAIIVANAEATTGEIASFLRGAGGCFQVRARVDAELIKELSRISADQGRIGGVFAGWLKGHPDFRAYPVGQFSPLAEGTIASVRETQTRMQALIAELVKGARR